MSSFLFPYPSILHARRHNSQQVCRHRITGQQLSEHPAADTGTRLRDYSACVANLFLSISLLILCFLSHLRGCFLLCHVPVAVCWAAAVRFLLNFLHYAAPLSSCPSLDFSCWSQTTPTWISPLLLNIWKQSQTAQLPPTFSFPPGFSLFITPSFSFPQFLNLILSQYVLLSLYLFPWLWLYSFTYLCGHNIATICHHGYACTFSTLLFNPEEIKVSLDIKVWLTPSSD